ncbi:hypothetical protein, partial [Flavonifractor plautii]|uniref:hypothetical protein n=1 Tax=Flavonifractor plautii TaxID=292800 RepID=UPI003D7EAB2F
GHEFVLVYPWPFEHSVVGHFDINHIKLSKGPDRANLQVDLDVSNSFLTAVPKPIDRDLRSY